MKPRKAVLRVAAVAAAIAIAGCAQTQPFDFGDEISVTVTKRVPAPGEIESYLSDKPNNLRDHYRALFEGGTRNAVLNHMRIGLAAMQLGHFGHAEAAFEGALSRIERVYAVDHKAKLAKSKFQNENIKDFKGEPYERAMAYLYRGLLYLREGDYDNARATFLNGEFQDTVSEDEVFQGDFAVLNYLAGWASQCEGEPEFAEIFFKRARKHNPALKRPGRSDNVLFIAGIGNGPVKIGKGKHKEALGFQRGGGFHESSVRFETEGSGTLAATPATSIFWQATTRGGRPVEAILNGKAKFKEGTAMAADISEFVATQSIYQAGLENNTDLLNVGAAVAVAGIAFDLFSKATKPAADTRHWDNLPDSVAVATAYVPGDVGKARAVFTGKKGSFAQPAFLNSTAESCSVVWSRSRSALDIPAVAPGSELTKKQKRKLRKTLKQQQAAFRAELIAANTTSEDQS